MRIALFDWNGTLLDDIPIWYAAVCEIFRVYDKKPPTIAEYFREYTGDYLAVYRTRGITASREELNAIYAPYYATHIVHAKLFPGTKRTLRLLADRGITLGIVTAQQESLVVPLLEKFGLDGIFRDHAYHALDKVATIRRILAEAGVSAEECVFVGDSPSDVRNGVKTGVVTVALVGKYIPEDLIDLAGLKHKIHRLNELLAII